jgi:hypothetical protein
MYSISIQSNDASYPHKLLHGIEFEMIDPNASTQNGNNSRRRGYSYPIIQAIQQDYTNINIEISEHNRISNIPYINQVRQWSARQASIPGPIRTGPGPLEINPTQNSEEQHFISFSPRSSLDDLFETIFQRLRASQTAGESSDARRITRSMIRQQLGSFQRVTSSTHELIQNEHECSICQCAYQVNQGYRTLSCNHIFHKSCIDQWLVSGKTTCPMCRTEVIRI